MKLTLEKNKWMVFAEYNHVKSNIGVFLDKLGIVVDHYLPRYDNIILIGDFNSEINEISTSEFCDVYNLSNLIKELTCFKNPENPSSIDVILTNKSRSFQNGEALETGLPDHHKLVVTSLKSLVNKKKPVVIKYRDFTKYDAAEFRTDLYRNLRLSRPDMNYETFESTFMDILNKRAPLKEKLIRANTGPFMNKELSKAFMTRSRLRNKYLRDRTNENKVHYNKQRNYFVNLLRKSKRDYYSNLDVKLISDNKKFWKTVKPLFSEKHSICRNITLIEGNNVITNDFEVAMIMNNFFSLSVINLGIRDQGNEISDTAEDDPINKIIIRHRDQRSVMVVKYFHS